jgi:uncharacterized protein YacL (UPF0231 family)
MRSDNEFIVNTGDEVKIWLPLHDLMVRNNNCTQDIEEALLK